MENSKDWYKSKTIWAGVVTIISSAAAGFGYPIEADIQSGIIEIVLTIVTSVSGMVAIYGRITADKQVK